MNSQHTQISIKGRLVDVQSVQYANFTVVASGQWLKHARVKSEDYISEDPAANPESIIAAVRASRLRADLFSFAQRLPDTAIRFTYPMRLDNVAALPILGYQDWWEKRLNQDTRRCVRVAAKRGLEVRSVKFDDAFCQGIQGIYNESPIRQGRKFWHYGKDFQVVKQENSTFLDRSEFIGAYFGSELVGFLKMIYVGKSASIMQILAKIGHFERRPMNALMAKAVEICNERQMSFLLYRKYIYYKGVFDSVTEFKRRNGFEQVSLPRYYVPLTATGRLAIAVGLQEGFAEMLPARVVIAARAVGSRFLQSAFQTKESRLNKY